MLINLYRFSKKKVKYFAKRNITEYKTVVTCIKYDAVKSNGLFKQHISYIVD